MNISLPCYFKNKHLIAYLLMLFLNAPANAQENQRIWQTIAPRGAAYNSIQALGVSLNHPDTLYLATHVLLKSIDSGITWNAVKQKNGELMGIQGRRLLVDPNNPQIIIAAIFEGYYPKVSRSTDGGVSWGYLDSTFYGSAWSIFELTGQNMSPLVIQSNSQTGTSHITRSYDGGEHWIKSATPISPIGGRAVTIHAVDQENSDIMYGVIYLGEPSSNYPLYKTIDGGRSWFKIQPTNIDYNLHQLQIHPADSRILFARIIDREDTSHFIKSDDGGLSWHFLSALNNQFRLGDRLFIDPIETDILYANVVNLEISNNTVHESLFAKSIDAGESWQIKHTGFFSKLSTNSPILIHPQNNQTLFWADSELGVISSDNGGDSWQPLNIGTTQFGGHLTVAKDDPSTMYLVNNGWGRGFNYYTSSDGGEHWEKFITTELDSVNHDPCRAFILNPLDSNDMWCHNAYGNRDVLYRSKNAGVSWTQLNEPEEWASYPVIANDGKTLYRKGSSFMKKSIDNGKTWQPLPHTRDSRWPIVINPENADIIYTIALVEGSSSVYKSEDGGINWVKQIGGVNHIDRQRLIISDSQPELLVFIDELSIDLTKDGGRSWKRIPHPFQDAFFQRHDAEVVAFNPKNLDGLFVVTGKGVFETKDLGETWEFLKAYEPDMSIQLVSGEIYLSSAINIYQLTASQFSSVTTNCLFDWAAQQYPDIFSPAIAESQFFGEYVYRYYSDTNTYLGLFQDQRIHQRQPSVSDAVKDTGSIEHYLNVSQCENK